MEIKFDDKPKYVCSAPESASTCASNPISDTSIDFSESKGNTSEEISLFSYFGNEETNSSKILKASPYEKIKYSKSELDEMVASIKARAKQEGIDFDKLSTEEKIRYTALALAVKSGRITETEFLALIADDVSEIEAAKIREYLKEHSDELDENKVKLIRKDMERASAIHAALIQSANENIFGKDPADTRKRREKFLLRAAEKLPAHQKTRMGKISDALPENCGEKTATKILELSGESSTLVLKKLEIYAKTKAYSSEFFNSFNSITVKIAKQINDFVEDFKENFFNTAKGKAIKKYIRNQIEEIKEKKEQVDAQKADLEKKINEAKIKEEKCNKKMEEARKQKQNAKALLEKYNVKDDLKNNGDTEKILGEISIQEKIKYSAAMENLKKAQKEDYDANSAKRLAQAFYEIDLKSLMFRIALLRAKIAAFMT